MATNQETFADLLKLTKITRAYFVDDYLPGDHSLEALMVMTGKLIKGDSADVLIDGLKEVIDLKKVPEEEINNKLRQYFDSTNDEGKEKFARLIHSLSDNDYLKQVEFTSKVIEFFPKGLAVGIHPAKWNEEKQRLAREVADGRVLLLFDQDLTKASGFERRSGIDLINELKKEEFFDKLTCILISNDIQDTTSELPTRADLIKGLDLTDSDFFPLSKTRLDNANHFYDGIKKSILNAHCELIKQKSSGIVEQAYKVALDQIKKINTYDFDHTIFQSSYEEGIWEVETLFRISEIFFDEAIKKEIVRSNFQKDINIHIRESKQISDIRFEIDRNTEPYAEKYKLRNTEIYEDGQIINRMYKPIENGDIFEIFDGQQSARGFYILVSQECDLVVRNPKGDRALQFGQLFRIEVVQMNAFEKRLNAHYRDHQRDFYDSKFKLDYFTSGTDDVGIVLLKKPLIVDLQILDLIVFNPDGVATLNIKEKINTNVFSFAWESRYYKIHKSLQARAEEITRVTSSIAALPESAEKVTIQQILRTNQLRLSPISTEVGTELTLQGDLYSFGIKRISSFRRPGSSILLDKLTKYQSRLAEPHDFVAKR